MTVTHDQDKAFDDWIKDYDWIKDLEDKEQPTCNIDNPEDCENCGS